MNEKKPDPSALVFPFGKHRGHTVAEVLASDPQYADWIATQGWVSEKFAELHAVLMSRGAATDDTPEHNALQARFMDPVFRVALFLALGLPVKKNKTAQWYGASRWHEADIEWSNEIRTYVAFENRGIDVGIGYYVHGIYHDHLNQAQETGDKIASIAVELKPSLGDDFPSVMRQMARTDCGILVVGDYNGKAVPIPTLRDMFKANGRTMIFVREIEAQLPNAAKHFP